MSLVFLMARCPYCRIPDRRPSRIKHDVAESCLKNRVGACFACEKLADIERKIDNARRALEHLLDEREALVQVLNEQHDPIIRHLPPELISRIFVHLKPVVPSAYTYDGRYDEGKLLRAVFNPSQVCQDWRRIAQRTPHLWTTLCVSIGFRNFFWLAPMVSDWLQRSGGLSLSIQFRIPWSADAALYQAAREVMTSIICHAQRWETLALEVPSPFLPWVSIALSHQHLDRLRDLKATIVTSDSGMLRLRASPSRLIQRTGRIGQISVDLSQLTDVFVDIMTAPEALALFRAAPRLLSCNILDFRDQPERIPPNQIAFAPSLVTLIIKHPPASFWNHCVFPSLQNLNLFIAFHDYDDVRCWNNLRALLRRSGCNIQHLTIEDNIICQEELVEFLRLTPNIKHLSIVSYILNESLFSVMETAVHSSDTQQPLFLASLQSLSCSTSSTFDWSLVPGFLSAVVARPGRTLQSFEFHYKTIPFRDPFKAASVLGEGMFERIMGAAAGLEVKICDYNGRDLVVKEMQREDL